MDNSYFDSLAVVLPEDIEKLKWRGEFDRAVRRIDSRLEKDIPQALRKRLMIEKEILKRMPGQYPYTWTEALGILRDNVRDFKDYELETLWEEDAADWIYVDGEVRFRSSFLKNVLKTRKEYENLSLIHILHGQYPVVLNTPRGTRFWAWAAGVSCLASGLPLV